VASDESGRAEVLSASAVAHLEEEIGMVQQRPDSGNTRTHSIVVLVLVLVLVLDWVGPGYEYEHEYEYEYERARSVTQV